MVHSMTGFASVSGSDAGFAWTWELRGVNGKGLDLRIRVPDWVDGLEAQVRALAGKELSRGNVQISLRLTRDAQGQATTVDPNALASVLGGIQTVHAAAEAAGVALAPATAAEVLNFKGVLVSDVEETDSLRATLVSEFRTAIEEFQGMRAREGAALSGIAQAQLAEIAALTDQAASLLEARRDRQADHLRTALGRVVDAVEVDEDRIAQELALVAVKSDVTEEIDRLRAHVAAAQELLAAHGPIGRKLDFLMQEFNREANTLCSKAQMAELTRVGLDLKVVIDQLREQIQNVE